ncbi:MAG: hypothetical protein ACRDIC_24800 [bacterium]
MIRSREPADGSRDVWLGPQARDQFLDLSPGLVPGGVEEIPMICRSQMRRQEHY